MLFDLKNQQIANDNSVVLNGISLQINAGEKIAILGKSGAGKSTLLRYLYQQKQQQTAWIPQDPSLVNVLSVYHNVYMGRLDTYPLWRNLWNLLLPFDSDKQAITQLLNELTLSEKLLIKCNQLSGGQQQRASVARGLYQSKKLIMADEPVSAVDVKQGAAILQLINNKTETVIIALHDAQLALENMQRIIGIKDGKIALDASSNSITMDDIHKLYEAKSI